MQHVRSACKKWTSNASSSNASITSMNRAYGTGHMCGQSVRRADIKSVDSFLSNAFFQISSLKARKYFVENQRASYSVSSMIFCFTILIESSYSRFFAFSSNYFFQNYFYLSSRAFIFCLCSISSSFILVWYLFIIFISSSLSFFAFFSTSFLFRYNPISTSFYLFLSSKSLPSWAFCISLHRTSYLSRYFFSASALRTSYSSCLILFFSN